MSVYSRPTKREQMLRQIIQDLVRPEFDKISALIAVAEMLAVAFRSSDETKISFRDPQFEPDAERWDFAVKEIINGDTRLQKTLNLRWPSSRDCRHPVFPHSLELVRRALLERDEVLEGEYAHSESILAIYYLLIEFWREPKGLTREAEAYAVKCLRVRSGDDVYCAYPATAGVALLLAGNRKRSVTLEFEGHRDLAEICAWLGVAGHLNLTIIGGHPLLRLATDLTEQKQRAETSAVAIVFPPSRQRSEGSDLDKHWATANLPPSTQMCGANAILATMRGCRSICFTDGELLRHTYKIDQIFKESLIRHSKLDAIVRLHASVYDGSTPGHESMLIFGSAKQAPEGNTGADPRVLMVDARLDSYLRDNIKYRGSDEDAPSRFGRIVNDRAETEISLLISIDKIGEHNFNLVIDRYVYPQILSNSQPNASFHRITLEQVADIHRPQPLPSASRGATEASRFLASQEDLSPYLEVSALDIEEAGFVRHATKKVTESPELLHSLRKSRLEPGDIIMLVKGSVGKVGYIREIPEGKIWLASQSFVIIRLRRFTAISDPLVLFRYLSSKIGQMMIEQLTARNTVASLQMADVRRVKMVVPPRDKEDAVARKVNELFALQDEIEALLEKINEKRQSFWPEADFFE